MNIIAIDLGGTNTRVAVINKSYEILEKISFATIKNPVQNFNKIINEINELNFDTLEPIAICLPGPLNTATGLLGELPNLPEYSNFNVVEYLEMKTNRKIIVQNDANAAALGEAIEYNSINNVIYFTISTGFGSGFVNNDEIYEGEYGTAFEVHNTLVETDVLGSKQLMNIEKICSGTGIKNIAKELGMEIVNAKEVIDEYHRGNKVAKKTIDEFVIQLSIFLLNINYIMCPGIIILGGSVILNNEFLFERITKVTKEQSVLPIRLEKAINGDDAGLLGVSKLGFLALQKERIK